MISRSIFASLLAVSASISLLACGGKVVVDAAGSSGGGSSTSSTSSTSFSSSSSSSSSGAVDCAGLAEVDCLGAYPACAPVYDDHCCPSCDPVGGCADCINIGFHHCAPLASVCSGIVPCGQTPGWACKGGKADCAIPPEGSSVPCATRAGCIPAYCPTNVDCKTDPICVAITAQVCTIPCDAIPPPCPVGTSAEGDGACFTGLCVPIDLCAKPL